MVRKSQTNAFRSPLNMEDINIKLPIKMGDNCTKCLISSFILYKDRIGFTRMTKLKNLGNTCFINSILQCLSIPELHTWFTTATKDSLLFNEYKDLDKLLFEEHEGIAPNRFVSVLYHTLPFQRFQQEDAHELLLFLLDEFQCPLFQGKKISHIDTTTVEETFLSLEVPIRPTLDESIRAYIEPEEVEWNGKKVMKWYEIVKLPTLLWITLKRFDNKNKKNTSFVQIPLEMDGYELVAVCNHFGNTRGGHYTAMVKKDRWYECNDEVIQPTNPITNHAYCLLFRKKTV